MNTLETLTRSELETIVGGLSSPSKMPCHSYSIPARACITGSKLQDVPGSVCAGCYALKGRYGFANVQNALERRLASLRSEQWIPAMVQLLTRYEKSGFFRWHDSGDLQGVWHLQNIVEVCKATPHLQHWLPTREYAIVGDYLRQGGTIPANLTIRYSALMFNAPAPEGLAQRHGVNVSSASTDEFTCPASKQGNVCGDCRLCWNKQAFNVTYKKH